MYDDQEPERKWSVWRQFGFPIWVSVRIGIRAPIHKPSQAHSPGHFTCVTKVNQNFYISIAYREGQYIRQW